jgi:hypothetical protein
LVFIEPNKEFNGVKKIVAQIATILLNFFSPSDQKHWGVVSPSAPPIRYGPV